MRKLIVGVLLLTTLIPATRVHADDVLRAWPNQTTIENRWWIIYGHNGATQFHEAVDVGYAVMEGRSAFGITTLTDPIQISVSSASLFVNWARSGQPDDLSGVRYRVNSPSGALTEWVFVIPMSNERLLDQRTTVELPLTTIGHGSWVDATLEVDGIYQAHQKNDRGSLVLGHHHITLT